MTKYDPADTLDWHDISMELWREYSFPGGNLVRIEAPQRVAIKVSGGGHSHRVVCKDGSVFYIPAGWIALHWMSDGDHQPIQF